MLYYSVPKRAINTLIDNILDDFEISQYSDFMKFSQNVLSKYSIQFLQLWYVAKGIFRFKQNDIELFLSADEVLVLDRLKKFYKYR